MHANVNVGLYESRLIYILYFWNILYKVLTKYELYIIINYKLYKFYCGKITVFYNYI